MGKTRGISFMLHMTATPRGGGHVLHHTKAAIGPHKRNGTGQTRIDSEVESSHVAIAAARACARALRHALHTQRGSFTCCRCATFLLDSRHSGAHRTASGSALASSSPMTLPVVQMNAFMLSP